MADRRALVIDSPGSIGLRGVDELVPGPGEVVARPVHIGVCGTDLELLAGIVQVRLAPLITHRFPLDEYEHAYQILRESFGPRGKVILDASEP